MLWLFLPRESHPRFGGQPKSIPYETGSAMAFSGSNLLPIVTQTGQPGFETVAARGRLVYTLSGVYPTERDSVFTGGRQKDCEEARQGGKEGAKGGRQEAGGPLVSSDRLVLKGGRVMACGCGTKKAPEKSKPAAKPATKKK